MGKNLVIAVCGTPGTGKSTFSKKLVEEEDYALVDLNEIIEEEGIYEKDPDGTRAVDSDDLREVFDRRFSSTDEDLVVDGLLSYLLSPEQVTNVVVLRTHPEVLKERLEERGYSESKLKDNVDSEALSVVLGEAVQIHGVDKVFEIDTTRMGPDETVATFKEALDGKKTLAPGSVDWLEDYFQDISGSDRKN